VLLALGKSPKRLSAARRARFDFSLPIDFSVGFGLPWCDTQVDYVIASHVVEHVDERLRISDTAGRKGV